jgi:hypothetical protein
MNKRFKVAREYRTHPLSKTDGGVTVVVEFKDAKKKSREYPDVKNPGTFIDAIHRKDSAGEVARAYVVVEERFLIVVDKKNRCYAKLESPWPDWDLDKAGFKPHARFLSKADRDKAWDELKSKQEEKKC